MLEKSDVLILFSMGSDLFCSYLVSGLGKAARSMVISKRCTSNMVKLNFNGGETNLPLLSYKCQICTL